MKSATRTFEELEHNNKALLEDTKRIHSILQGVTEAFENWDDIKLEEQRELFALLPQLLRRVQGIMEIFGGQSLVLIGALSQHYSRKDVVCEFIVVDEDGEKIEIDSGEKIQDDVKLRVSQIGNC